MDHSHIPFVVILLQKLKEWQQSHDGENPIPSLHRKAFLESINSFRKTDNADAENVDEAIGALGQHVWRPIAAAQDGGVPPEIRALLRDEVCTNTNEKVSVPSRVVEKSCVDQLTHFSCSLLTSGSWSKLFVFSWKEAMANYPFLDHSQT